MYLFSLECSTQQTGIAILEDKKVLAKKIWKSNDTSKEILPAIDNLLKSMKMSPEIFDYFIVSSGPGSWTGIRLSISIAYGLSVAEEEKVYGVSALEAIAYRFKEHQWVGVVFPSAGERVHYSIFKNPELLAKKHGKIYSCEKKKIVSRMEKARIIAGPCEKILSLFTCKELEKVAPDPVLNANLAFERIKNSVKPRNQPYYEK